MGPDLWLRVAVGVLAIGQVAVFWYLYRRSNVSTTAGSSVSHAASPETDRVVCPDCGTTNEPTFRYCQHCVSELPGRASSADSTGGPESRGLS